MRFVEKLESPEQKVKISLKFFGREVQVDATDENGVTSALLGIRDDGTVVRYAGQAAKLAKLGFQVDQGGFVKLFN